MKKTLSIFLAALMIFSLALPAFAEGEHTVTFQGPSASLLTRNPDGEDIGPAYYFAKTENGRPAFEPDPDGKYYLANDGYYHTPDELTNTPEELATMETYSPVVFATGSPVSINSGENLSFMLFTNEAYNPATAYVYINGVKAEKNEVGEYVVLADKDLNVRVDENALGKSMFNVILTSGEGYSIKTLQGQNYRMVPYGESFSFRVKIAKGYSDANLSVTVARGTNELAEFLGEDADLLNRIMSTEKPVSNGVDSDGCRTYTIEKITADCKVTASGVREAKKADILTYLKRILKMILDVFHIDTSFLGLDVINLNYYTVNIDDGGISTDTLDYTMITGTTDPFKMNQFNVMGGEGVTIEFVTYDETVPDRLRVTWDPGNTGGTYSNVWTAKLNRSTGKTYYTTTFMIDNINATTNVAIRLA